MIFSITKILKKRQEQKDEAYYVEMKEEVKTMSNEDLQKINADFHHGIDMDEKMGHKVRPVMHKVNQLIEDEMHERGLMSCDDLEEEIWLLQHGFAK